VDHEEFTDEFRERAGTVSLDETEAVVRAHLGALRGASPGTRQTGSPPTCRKN